MAADWRGWRLIVVNGERFRWRKTFETYTDIVRVRTESNPVRLLTVWHGYAIAVPGTVRVWIETATARGWPHHVPNLEMGESVGSDCALTTAPVGPQRDPERGTSN